MPASGADARGAGGGCEAGFAAILEAGGLCSSAVGRCGLRCRGGGAPSHAGSCASCTAGFSRPSRTRPRRLTSGTRGARIEGVCGGGGRARRQHRADGASAKRRVLSSSLPASCAALGAGRGRSVTRGAAFGAGRCVDDLEVCRSG